MLQFLNWRCLRSRRSVKLAPVYRNRLRGPDFHPGSAGLAGGKLFTKAGLRSPLFVLAAPFLAIWGVPQPQTICTCRFRHSVNHCKPTPWLAKNIKQSQLVPTNPLSTFGNGREVSGLPCSHYLSLSGRAPAFPFESSCSWWTRAMMEANKKTLQNIGQNVSGIPVQILPSLALMLRACRAFLQTTWTWDRIS
jgi:hypothetical protein